MSNIENDWRLEFAPENFRGITLRRVRHKPHSKQWDHEHCILCNRKICESIESAEKTAYRTEDSIYWVCEQCVNDLKSYFNWKLTSDDI